MIREDKNMKGISIGETEDKISEYAADTEIILEGDRKSLTYVAYTHQLQIYVFIFPLMMSAETSVCKALVSQGWSVHEVVL